VRKVDVLIIGAGLAGLAAASRLGARCLVLEAEDEPGGACRSLRAGSSVYDYTGHLLHLRREETRELVGRLLPDAFNLVERRAAVWSQGCFVPYPFQANFHPLPLPAVRECLLGYLRAREAALTAGAEERSRVRTFGQWALATFGDGICNHFMFPYNSKVFRAEPDEMSADWVSWSVPRPDLETVVDGALGSTAEGLGYNPSFLYPKEGGIEALPRALAAEAEREGAQVLLRQRVSLVDPGKRTVITDSGGCYQYVRLISTAPLPKLLEYLHVADERPALWASLLRWVGVYNLNLTLRRAAPWPWQWLYLPGGRLRCYRVGVATNFSPALAPRGCMAVYTEISYQPGEADDDERLREAVLNDLRLIGLLRDRDRIVDEAAVRIEPAYVVHDPWRAANIELIHAWLAERGIISTGRWGAWTYGGMEDAINQGLEAAERSV